MAKIMTVRPPDKLHRDLKEAAKAEGFTLNALVLQILWDWVKKNTRRSG